MTEETSNPMREAIQSAISENPVILFMKGNPDAPACGFSARTVGILQSLGQQFAAVDILPDPRIRQELSAISGWPTIPQLFHKGELVGGCDIVMEMYETGELAEQLGVAAEPEAEAPEAVTPEGPPLTIENRLNYPPLDALAGSWGSSPTHPPTLSCFRRLARARRSSRATAPG